ncbi:GNAT family N-acetyltransferase [Nocardioides terrisoli]|uniref:GNAT family N-acetyltransferase n=1 Tax=Nocardioides terrisoli TaxID=3388267 RepID=UPI00287B70F5|nr:GNAT family protein [Nocardioides marmorisolisilvae]
MPRNEFDQPIGTALPRWSPRLAPEPARLSGRWCSLVSLDGADLDRLYDVLAVDAPPSLWTYLSGGPFSDRAGFDDYLGQLRELGHPMVVLAPDEVGIACFLNTAVQHGSTEVGAVSWAPALQRTTAATEAVLLMMRHAFDDLGYRRFEWKCDSLNEPSCRAAVRLGFTAEGTFRNAVVYKGRSRDTAWFSITDAEWQQLRPAYDAWLDPDNFDDSGRQRRSLAQLRAVSPPAARR